MKASSGVETLKRVRVRENVRFAFGQVEWGGPHLALMALAGAVVYSNRIRCLPAGSDLGAFLVADPVYVRNLDGSLVSYEVVGGDRVREQVLDAATWEAWFGGVGVRDAQR